VSDHLPRSAVARELQHAQHTISVDTKQVHDPAMAVDTYRPRMIAGSPSMHGSASTGSSSCLSFGIDQNPRRVRNP
jgi:hypothetical protein